MNIRLDVHVHQIPLRRADVAGLNGIGWSANDRLLVDGAEMPKRELYQPDALIRWMDENGVRQAWISVPPTLYRMALEPEPARAWADALNAALSRVAAATDGRLAPLYHLPMQHPAVAADVAGAAIAQGQSRFAMAAGDAQRGRMLSDPEYRPLWAALQQAGAFLLLHPHRACDARLEQFSLSNLLGGPTETAIAAAHLAMSGVLQGHPSIVFCLAHGGGTAAAVAGRLERGQDTERAGAYLGGEKVRQAFRRFCVDCITHDSTALAFVAATFGADRVLFGSDWPFEMGLSRPAEQLQDLSSALREQICVGNPERLFGDSQDGPGAAQPKGTPS